MTNSIKVMARLDNGDTITVSVKTNDKPFSSKEKEVLLKRIDTEINPILEDTLYITIRTTIDGKKDNWKCKSLGETREVVDKIFGN